MSEGQDRVVCRKCGAVVTAQLSEEGTFYGYWCSPCDDETPTDLEHFDGTKWVKV